MKMKLVLDVDKCCACGACAVACMDQNDIDIAHMTPFRRVADFELNGEYLYTSVSCMHCDDAPCIQGCPVGVLRKDPVTNLTVYDNTNCIGCHSCAMACPVGAPSFDSHNKMVKYCAPTAWHAAGLCAGVPHRRFENGGCGSGRYEKLKCILLLEP